RVARIVVVDDLLRVLRGGPAALGLDEHRKRRQVPADIEYARDARGGDVVVDGVAQAVDFDLALVGDELAIVREDVLQQPEAVAGRAVFRIEVAPHGSGRRLELGLVLRVGTSVWHAKAYSVAEGCHAGRRPQ